MIPADNAILASTISSFFKFFKLVALLEPFTEGWAILTARETATAKGHRSSAAALPFRGPISAEIGASPHRPVNGCALWENFQDTRNWKGEQS